jgi:hypothetical protein
MGIRPLRRTLLVWGIALAGAAPLVAEEIAVDADFPGGNIILETIEGDVIRVRQDLRDTKGDWFYWCFRVRGAAGRTFTVHFTKGNVIGVRGPAVSMDGGRSWRWLGAVKGSSFQYAVPAGTAEVRFCFTMPYLESDLKAFLSRHVKRAHLRIGSLCRSRKGRDIELLRFGRVEGAPAHRVLLTARHHCCESMASYALEGLIGFVMEDGEDGAWLRRHVAFLAVPFMDKDGVEDGDQGKNRKPHDHNRDYVQAIYPSVRALKTLVPAWSAGRVDVALDLHCPWIRGTHNEVIYFVGGKDQALWGRVTAFARILESVRKGPLVYRAGDNLPFGKAWNTGRKDPALMSCKGWTSGLPGIRVASTIEIPYANAGGGEVNAETARAFGADLGRALRAYLDRPATERAK